MTSTISPPIDILLDTNVLWQPGSVLALFIQASRRGQVRVHIPALVLVERERQLVQRDRVRAARGLPTDLGRSVRLFRQWVEQLVFDLTDGSPHDDPVLAFDQAQAQWVSAAWGEWLADQPADYLVPELSAEEADERVRQRFRRKWKGKRRLPDLDWAVHKADWSIAAAARHTGWLILTNDADAPFQQPGVWAMRVNEFVSRIREEWIE